MGFLQRFFYGRNGSDPLNMALLAVAILCSILSRFFFGTLFFILAYAALFLAVFRMLSRNLEKRRQENALFLQKTQGIRAKFQQGGTGRSAAQSARPRPARVKKDRANYRYFKCPNCKQPMRVPRGKGKIKVKCSGCSLEFFKKV